MRFRTVRTKLFVAMGSAITVFVLMSLFVVARVATEFGEEEISRNIQFARDAFQGYLDTRRQLLQDKGRTLADAPYLKATLSIEDVDHETAFYLADELAKVGQSDVLLLVDSTGVLLADSSSSERHDVSLLNQPMVSQALNGTEGSAVWSWQDEILLVTVSPVTTPDALLGVLVLGRRIDDAFADHVRQATGLDVLLFHRETCLAWSYDQTRSGVAVPKDATQAESLLAPLLELQIDSTDVVRHAADHETRLYSTIRAGDLHIVLSRSLSDFESLSTRAAGWLLMLGGGLLIVASTVSFQIARRVSQPIARLVQASEQMAQGQLQTRVAVIGDDELATLSESFNTMARQIDSLVRDVRAAAEIAHSASQSKSNFLANISHELRTPLNGIIGFTGLLLEHTESDHTSEPYEWLQTIDRSSRQLLSVIEDILDVSRIEEGRLSITLARCHVRSTIETVCSQLLASAEEKGLSLNLKFGCEFPDVVLTDGDRLAQLLHCLIHNAIKFTPHGEIRVVADYARGDDSGRLQIAVTDTGIGIPESRLEAIFQPFVQADGSLTREFGGVGLGLTISKRIAEALGGSLTVTSQVGRGSTFNCEIDAACPDTGQAEKPSTDSYPSGPEDISATAMKTNFQTVRSKLESPVSTSTSSTSMQPDRVLYGATLNCRVLVVDDAVPNRRLVSLVLRKAGATVEEAVDGQEAIDRFEACPFDLIFMDMQMPVMDGYTATRELRSRGVTIPIIALTAHAMVGDREKCEAAGCSHYLTKPVTPVELIDAATTALNSGIAAMPNEQPQR